MSEKAINKTTKPLAPKAAAKQSDTPYPVAQDLNSQQERLRKAAAAGAEALKSRAPTATAKLPTSPAAAPPKPPTPRADVWPNSGLLQGESRPFQAPASQGRKTPLAATVSKVSPAPAPQSPKPFPKSPPLKAPAKAAVGRKTPVPTAPQVVKVTFVLLEPDATCVSLCGEFNGWSPGAAPMKRHEDGHWETTVALAPGRHQYKFFVDGEWIPDPLARENVFNQHGTLNSVIEVRV